MWRSCEGKLQCWTSINRTANRTAPQTEPQTAPQIISQTATEPQTARIAEKVGVPLIIIFRVAFGGPLPHRKPHRKKFFKPQPHREPLPPIQTAPQTAVCGTVRSELRCGTLVSCFRETAWAEWNDRGARVRKEFHSKLKAQLCFLIRQFYFPRRQFRAYCLALPFNWSRSRSRWRFIGPGIRFSQVIFCVSF